MAIQSTEMQHKSPANRPSYSRPLSQETHDLPIIRGGCGKHLAVSLSILLLIYARTATAALSAAAAAMNQPIAPFRIAGNLFYVGASDVASYLVVTSQGLILIDAGFAETAPQIESNIVALGFRLGDVKWLLNGHAHPDHAGGLSQLRRDTGAQLAAMSAEVEPLEHSGRGTFYLGDRTLFDSVHIDRVLKDGDVIELGGIRLTALLTAGHTPGCTTWTLQIHDGDHRYHAVIACQLSVPSPDASYPGMDADFRRTFTVLRTLPCEVFLAEHGTAFSLEDKLAKKAQAPAVNPFIDPTALQRFVVQSEADFREHLGAPNRMLSK
jgi:metallo-beta-lactamase class B